MAGAAPRWVIVMSAMFDYAKVYIVTEDEDYVLNITSSLRATGLEVRAYGSAAAFLSELNAARRDCVIVEVSRATASGLDLIRALAVMSNSLSVVAVGALRDGSPATEAIRAGASEFIEKSLDTTMLIAAIRRAMDGFGTTVRLRAQTANAMTRLSALSRRERDVLDGFAKGLTIKEIAGSLALSPKSVETYRARLIEKMNAKSAANLMRIALLASLDERF